MGGQGTYIAIGHVPVGPLSVGQDLPHNDPITPHVTGGGEFAVSDGFRRRPADRDFSSLERKNSFSYYSVTLVQLSHTLGIQLLYYLETYHKVEHIIHLQGAGKYMSPSEFSVFLCKFDLKLHQTFTQVLRVCDPLQYHLSLRGKRM